MFLVFHEVHTCPSASPSLASAPERRACEGPGHRSAGNSPPRATACPWRSPRALRWAGGRRHRWGPPSCRGTASSTAPPSAPGRRRSAPSCPRERDPLSSTAARRAGSRCSPCASAVPKRTRNDPCSCFSPPGGGQSSLIKTLEQASDSYPNLRLVRC